MRDDGCLIHVGREDFQVKIRGHRVEVGEIETALLDHPGVKEAVVIAHEDSRGEKRLAAYLVASREFTPSIGTLRDALAVRLPDHMLPTAFMFLDTLPLTPSGKVDRRALPTPRQEDYSPDGAFVAPRSPRESALADMWSQVLGRTHVGIHENFFALGGHSLLATQVIARVRNAFGVELAFNSVFEMPTVASLAVAIAQMLAGNLAQSHLMEDGVERLLTGLEGDPNLTPTLLANSYAANANAAKGVAHSFVGYRAVNHAITRIRLIATAIRICWSCVFAKPM